MDQKIKVLFISPEFFQYINAITEELGKNNIEVTYFKWWPTLGVFKKYFFKKNEKKRKKIMDKYLDEILEKKAISEELEKTLKEVMEKFFKSIK